MSQSPLAFKLRDLAIEIDKAFAVTAQDASWCNHEKASTLAALVIGLRPKVVVELGVWMGGSAIPMAIALRHLEEGQLIAIDAWSSEASVAGQDENHAKWWGQEIGAEGHEKAYKTFLQRLEEHHITRARCQVRRQRTDEAEVPPVIDLLHHDANHGPQALLDIKRWAPAVRVGGILVFDDLDWVGGDGKRSVRAGRDYALELGFVEMYDLGTGCVMQRVRGPQA